MPYTLVNPTDGSWSEVVTSFAEFTASTILADTHLAVVTDGGVLVTNGVGFNPATWQGDDRFTGGTEVKRSILGLRLTAIPFRPIGEYPGHSLAAEELVETQRQRAEMERIFDIRH